ncbi:hypothetical protein DESPIG_00989 [Desulfovibrio piger ATCC 29098]|uniref:Uncharacterized protein n=1 Tax=Desulfovibrio piger ATCC 29098 TaxID=411464 RepID=B6WSK0_9BACT|nr:hypothetical protein DESPIG_00989 [Desulfovibrio piger ATCC 29098]
MPCPPPGRRHPRFLSNEGAAGIPCRPFFFCQRITGPGQPDRKWTTVRQPAASRTLEQGKPLVPGTARTTSFAPQLPAPAARFPCSWPV